MEPGRVRLIQGYTDLIATGTGTGGSSSIPCGGASLAGATKKLAGRLKDIAAEALEAAASHPQVAHCPVRGGGPARASTFAQPAPPPPAPNNPPPSSHPLAPD